MGFRFPDEEPKQPTTVTIPIEEYDELKQAMTFIEDQGYTKKFMMYQGLFNPPEDNLDTGEDDIIFTDVQVD